MSEYKIKKESIKIDYCGKCLQVFNPMDYVGRSFGDVQIELELKFGDSFRNLFDFKKNTKCEECNDPPQRWWHEL